MFNFYLYVDDNLFYRLPKNAHEKDRTNCLRDYLETMRLLLKGDELSNSNYVNLAFDIQQPISHNKHVFKISCTSSGVDAQGVYSHYFRNIAKDCFLEGGHLEIEPTPEPLGSFRRSSAASGSFARPSEESILPRDSRHSHISGRSSKSTVRSGRRGPTPNAL